jgi:hypothetical protein
MRLLERLASRYAIAAMARSTGQIPPRRSAVTLVAGDAPLLSAAAQMLRHAVVRPATPEYTRVSAQLQALVEAVLTRRLEPAAAAARADAELGVWQPAQQRPLHRSAHERVLVATGHHDGRRLAGRGRFSASWVHPSLAHPPAPRLPSRWRNAPAGTATQRSASASRLTGCVGPKR